VDLVVVREPVAVAVRGERVGAERALVGVEQAVEVGVGEHGDRRGGVSPPVVGEPGRAAPRSALKLRGSMLIGAMSATSRVPPRDKLTQTS
jgi:hypothetical protein